MEKSNFSQDSLPLLTVSPINCGDVLTEVENIDSENECKQSLYQNDTMLSGNNHDHLTDQEFIECSDRSSDVDNESRQPIITAMCLEVVKLERVNQTVASNPIFDTDVKHSIMLQKETTVISENNVKNMDAGNLTEAEGMSASSNGENVTRTTMPELCMLDFNSIFKCGTVKSDFQESLSFLECRKKKKRSGRHKQFLDVSKSESDESTNEYNKCINKENGKIKKYRKGKSTVSIIPHHLTLPRTKGSGLTDTELLTDSDENRSNSSSSFGSSDNNIKVAAKFDTTDVEDFSGSDMEDNDLIPPTSEKEICFFASNTCNENTKIRYREDFSDNNKSAVDTDEEGFQFEAHEDTEPLLRPKHATIVLEEITIYVQEMQNDYEVHTDSEAITCDECEDEEILLQNSKSEPNILDIMHNSNIKEKLPGENNNLHCVMPKDTENLIDVDAIVEGEHCELSINHVLNWIKKDSSTYSECFEYSDDEKLDSKGLSWASKTTSSQPSEMHFLKTEHSSVDIIVTPAQFDRNCESLTDNIEGITFLDDVLTETEELCNHKDFETHLQNMVISNDITDSETDTEDFSESSNFELSKFLLPRANCSFVPSPKRERLLIIEREDGNLRVNSIPLDDMKIEAPMKEEEKEALTDSASVELCPDSLVNQLMVIDGESADVNYINKCKKQNQKKRQRRTKEQLNNSTKNPFPEYNYCSILNSIQPVVQDDYGYTDVEIFEETLVNLKHNTRADSTLTTDVEQSSDCGDEVINPAEAIDISNVQRSNRTTTKSVFPEFDSRNYVLWFKDNEGNKVTDTEDVEASEVEEFSEEAFGWESLPDYEHLNVTTLTQSFPHSFKEYEDSENKDYFLLTSQEHLTDVESLNHDDDNRN